MRKNRGFTLIELMVAMTILVIAFGLVTFLYTKAARIRKTVVVTSEIQQTLSQIMDTLTYGDSGDESRWGMIYSTGLDEAATLEETKVVLQNGTETMEITIDSYGDMQVAWPDSPSPDPITLNLGKKVAILADETGDLSKFEYFDGDGVPTTDSSKVSFIKITLWARSTDPALQAAPPVPLITGVKLRGKTFYF